MIYVVHSSDYCIREPSAVVAAKGSCPTTANERNLPFWAASSRGGQSLDSLRRRQRLSCACLCRANTSEPTSATPPLQIVTHRKVYVSTDQMRFYLPCIKVVLSRTPTVAPARNVVAETMMRPAHFHILESFERSEATSAPDLCQQIAESASRRHATGTPSS